jgi:hypothetical protein
MIITKGNLEENTLYKVKLHVRKFTEGAPEYHIESELYDNDHWRYIIAKDAEQAMKLAEIWESEYDTVEVISVRKMGKVIFSPHMLLAKGALREAEKES